MVDRPTVDISIDEEDDLDISLLAQTKKNKSPKADKEKLEEVAQVSGFTSREVKPVRRRARRSVFTQQKNIKMRPGMPDLFIDASLALDMKDYELLEHALELVLQKHKLTDELQRLKELKKESK